MTVPYYGDFPEDASVIMVFNTFTSNDPSASSTITDFVAGDVKIHKDGHVDQKASADGVAVFVNFDGITGNHMITIDTSNDTGAPGFWVAGKDYQVRIEGTTIDAATVNVFIGTFSIERVGGTVALLKLIQAAVITNATGVDVAADIIALKAETVLIVADTNEIQGKLPTNKFMGSSDGANDDGNINDILADTGELQTDDYPTSIAAVKAETALIVADTNEIQGKLPTNKFMGSSDGADDDGTLNTINTNAARLSAARAAILTDWIDGGRLDLLLDAIKVVTDNMSAAATTMITGTVSWDNVNATTTVIYSDDVAEATPDHFNGRLFVPTGAGNALLGQYTDITDYELVGAEGKFTVTALTEPPADNTTFVIL